MEKSKIKIGRHYAFREKRQPGVPFQQIRILEHTRGKKWKAEWIDPNLGLVDYVDSKQLVVPWKDRKAFLRDEEAEQRLREHAKENSVDKDSPVANALSEVFESMGEGLSFWHGALEGDPEALERATGWQDGIVNITDGNFSGFQSGFVNVTKGNFKGMQLGLYSSSRETKGLQLGVVNISEKLDGLQVGLVNINKSGKPHGFLPIVNYAF